MSKNFLTKTDERSNRLLTNFRGDLVNSKLEESLKSLQDEVLDSYLERLEYNLRGAYRSGYDYLHVYFNGLATAFIPANSKVPLKSHHFEIYELDDIEPGEYRHYVHEIR